MIVFAGSIGGDSSDYRYNVNHPRSDFRTCRCSVESLRYVMLDQWVKEAMGHAGITGAELSRRLSIALKRSVDRAAVSKMTKGQRAVSADELLAIAEITGHKPPVEQGASALAVPIVSWVTAGTMVSQSGVAEYDDHKKLYFAGLPDGDWIALEVEGDSMDRISPPGSIILVNRRERQLVANACYVIANEMGETTYKRFRPSPRRMEPVSTNPVHEPIYIDQGEPEIIGRVRHSILSM